jgi:tetratricopeptide (TPR) repeat protein
MTPAELHARALDLLVAGDTAGGITDLRAYLDARPDDADAWLSLGAAYAAIDHPVQAADALRRAVDLDSQHAAARLAYGRALVGLGRLDDAAAQLEAAAGLDATDARPLRELGVLRYDQRRLDDAAALLAQATALAPGDARAWYALGVVHEARRDVGAAVAAYRTAVARDPGLLDARRTLADALASLGEHQAAIAETEAILARRPDDEQAAHNRAVLGRALAELARRRLLGKDAATLAEATLLTAGGFRDAGGGRFTTPLCEVEATFDAAGALDAARLVLTDPARAAATADDVLGVTVITGDGRRVPADLGTALTLTFLREVLGCPLTTASALYARLLGGEAEVAWGGAAVAWGSAPRHGITARRRDRDG